MKTLKLKRLISNRRPFYVPEEGELLYELDTHRLYVGDGNYAGGYHVCNIDFSEVNDIPTTISGMFLKRNSSDTGYEWSHAASYFTDLKDVPLIYPSSDNYLHIVIDKNLVENDLTNAVVKLEISNNCGIDMKDLTYVINGFNEGLNELLSNSFVAPGATPADSLVWEIADTSLGSNSISIHKNEVKFSCVYGTSDTQSVRSMYYMSGDFDIQINWNQSTNVSPNRLFIGFGVSDDYNKYVDIRRHNYGTGAYQWVTYTETGYYDYGSCNFSSGTFRIKRVGSSFTCYIKNSGSDLWLASITKTHATIDNSVKVGLFVAVESTFPSIDVDFSDFIISSGKPCWSELHPYRKKLQITTINGVQCSTEIERFDTINSNITLHTIVPEISATYDTKLKLLYSLNMEDNTYVSDNVTNSGIENLVRYGVGSITESAYIGINEHRDGIELKLFNDSPYKFIDLYDTPDTYIPNKYLTTTASGIVLSDSAAISSSFIDLTDTPSSYIDKCTLRCTTSGIDLVNVPEWSSGGGAPIHDTGKLNDYYVDTFTNDLWMKKPGWNENSAATIMEFDIGSNDSGTAGLWLYGAPIDNGDYYTFSSSESNCLQMSDTTHPNINNMDIKTRIRISSKSLNRTQNIYVAYDGANGIAIGINSSNYLGIFGRVGSTFTNISIPPSMYYTDTWYTLYASNTKVVLLRDGTSDTVTVTGNCSIGSSTNYWLRIGGTPNLQSPIDGAVNNFFGGDVDYVKFYNRGTLDFPDFSETGAEWEKIGSVTSNHSVSFIELSDTPKSYTPNKYLTTTASGIVLSDSAAFSSSFIDLTDTPNDYIQGRYLVSTSSGIAFGNYAPTQGTQTVTLTTSGTMNYGDDYSFRINDFDYNYNFGAKDDFLSLDIQRWTIFNQSDITTASVTEDRPGIKFTIKGILTTNKYLYVRNAFLLNGDYSITLYGTVINTDYNHSGLEICIHDASYSNIGYVKSGYYSGNAFMSDIASSGFISASRSSSKFTIRIVRSGTAIHSMYDDGQTGFFTTLRSSTTTTDPHSLVIGMWSAAAATTDQVVVVDKVIMDYGTVSLDSNFTQPTVSGMLSHLSNAVEYYSSVNSTVVDNSLSISSNNPFDLTNVENFTTNYYSSAVSPINNYEYKSETFTVEIGGRYQCDTSAGSFVVTTPENPVAMDEFTIADATGTFAANNLLVSGTQNIRGISDTLALDVNWATVNMVYINESIGWRY